MDKYASIIEHKVTPKDDIENHQTKSTVGNQKQISNAFSEILKYTIPYTSFINALVCPSMNLAY